MLKRIIPFLFLSLLILFGCNDDGIPMYFRSLQPSGGKIFNVDVKEFLISTFPKRIYISTKDLNIDSTSSDDEVDDEFERYLNKLGIKGNDPELWFFYYLAVFSKAGKDLAIEINRNHKYVDMNIDFNGDFRVFEEFSIDSLFPDSIFSAMGTAWSKENIICFNKKNDKGYFEIDRIWEIDRTDGGINIYKKPFSVGEKSPIETFNKELGNMREEFKLEIVDINDSLNTYSADPGYMAFRWGLKQESYNFNQKALFTNEVYDSFVKRIETDSVKYEPLNRYIDSVMD